MLTNSQLQTLKVLAAADPTASGYLDGAHDIELANWFNTYDSTFYVWRTEVRVDECSRAMVWTEIDALTVGKARIWEWMSRLGTLDASQVNIRQGIADAFSAATNTRNALVAVAKRNATRAEKAFANTAGGNGNVGTPATMVFEGMLSYADASQVRSV